MTFRTDFERWVIGFIDSIKNKIKAIKDNARLNYFGAI